MIINGHKALGPGFEIKADTVVIRNESGTPVLLAVQMGPDTILVEQAGTPAFDRQLKNLGIDKGPLVHQIQLT